MQLTQSRIQSNFAGQGTISFPEPTCLLVKGTTTLGTSSARAFCSTHITSFNQSCPNKILKAYNFLIYIEQNNDHNVQS